MTDRDLVRHQAAAAKFRGQLQEPERCEDCGVLAKLSMHHMDYATPLVVEWLCAACHGTRHAGESRKRKKVPKAVLTVITEERLAELAGIEEMARERERLIRDLAAEHRGQRGYLAKLARLSGLTRARVTQIAQTKSDRRPGGREDL